MFTFGSTFAGIEGFGAGFEAAGMECLWQVEIEPDCRSVLACHFPRALRCEDVRYAGCEQSLLERAAKYRRIAQPYPMPAHEALAYARHHTLPYVDIICGGFPCQDLSVAGKRAGLEGSRSGLFYELVRITDELRPMFLVWENVPGLISSDDGRDFARVLRALDDIGYSGAWTGLDAQWFGVAQRRRRIFGVFARGDIGAARCAEILSLGSRLRRDTPTRRKAGQGVAATVTPSVDGNRRGWAPSNEADNLVASTLRSNGDAHSGFVDADGLVADALCSHHGGADVKHVQAAHIVTHPLKAEGADASEDGTGRGVPLVAATLKRRGRGACDEVIDNLVVGVDLQNTNLSGDIVGTLDLARPAHGGGQAVMVAANNFGEREVSTSLTASQQRIDPDTETFVVTAIRTANTSSNGCGVLQDGTTHTLGGSTDVVTFDWQSGGDVRLNVSGEHTSTLQANQTPAVAYQCQGSNVGEMGTLRRGNGNATGGVPFVFTQNTRDEVRYVNGDGQIAGALGAEPGMKQQNYLAWHENKSGQITPSATAKALRSNASHSYQGVGVRRLTPRECERLQGFPDDWTLYGANGEVISDSARYRMLGNAVADPCAKWIGQRIVSVMASFSLFNTEVA